MLTEQEAKDLRLGQKDVDDVDGGVEQQETQVEAAVCCPSHCRI